jgi:hypothetical protein
MEDETYVDPNVYRVKHHGKGPAVVMMMRMMRMRMRGRT